MSSFLTSGSLSQAVDDHLDWLAEWHRLAFFDPGPRAEQAKKLAPPPSFPVWYQSAIKSLPQDQPAIDHLAIMHDQLHTLARLVLMKTPDGEPLARKDYEAVLGKYEEFMQGLRRLERAFAVAASGLDLLTGLRSRVGLQEDLQREYSRFLRTEKPFCVAIMDVDHFKIINDTYGHDAGDRVLASVADHVSRSLRPFDDAYRLGGEEFLLCLKEADLATGLKVLERLRASLEKLPITLTSGPAINVTASFGLTAGAKDIAIEEMLHRADQALYRAKNQGRNAIVVLETD
jgi:diguanylate cyclase (GGDEF)-like protein